MSTRTLVTGAAGFLGAHLMQRLSAIGWQVSGTSHRPTHPISLACDITDATHLADIIKQTAPDIIFHTASLTPAAAPNASPHEYLRINVSGTINLLEAVHNLVPKARVILVTSSAMYGRSESPDGIIHEESALCPINPYGVSKATQHLIGYQYFSQHGLDVIRVCPFNLTGYGLPKGLVASDFAKQIVAIEQGRQQGIIRVGDLSGKRDFLDVQDAANALLSLAENGSAGEAYNLASSQAVAINDLLRDMLALTDAAIEVQPRDNIVKNTVPIQIGSHDKLTKITGWQPQVPLKQSLSEVLAYWRTAKVEEKA